MRVLGIYGERIENHLGSLLFELYTRIPDSAWWGKILGLGSL
jgi:hypothetical protein